jgi:hypothetical protein
MRNRKGMGRLSRRMIAIFFGVAIAGTGNVAWADPIGVGIDEFHTLPGTLAILPGGARLDLMSRPLDPKRGDTDTIVQRLDPLPALTVGGTGTTRIQITALSLDSVSPLSLGGSFFDVFVHLDPAVTQGIGSMTISQTNSNGGTFNAILPVDALLTFTQVGNPSNTLNQPFPHIEFTSGPATWSHTPPPGYPTGIGGGFHPTGTLQECNVTTPGCSGATVVHMVRPEQVVPEPSTLLLLGSGLAGIAAFGRKRVMRRG